MSELALFGGEPVVKEGMRGWPEASLHDEEAMLRADPRGRNGSECERFAGRFAAYCGVSHCIPVANGTVSLELILRGLGIGYGDEVILPPYTFIATMSSAIFACATPVFADIEPDTYNIDPDAVEKKITARTKAVIAVAIGGRPCDFERLEEIAKKHGIYLIVDAAQGVGARFNGRSIGSYGIAASFSCQNSKNLTSGEGGIITTNDDTLYENIRTILGYSGPASLPRLDHGLTEVQAALLNSQFDKLGDEILRRWENAAYLDGLLRGNEFVSPMKSDSRIGMNAYHLYLLRVNYKKLDEYGVHRDAFCQALNAEGFPLTPGYLPLYVFDCTKAPYLKKTLGREIDLTPCPNCEAASYREGTWFYHAVLLGSRAYIASLADAIEKVSDNLGKLR